jgi:hypothetical protein
MGIQQARKFDRGVADMKIQYSLALLIAGAVLVPGVADAHHSFAMFDTSKMMVKKAIIKEVQWANPHVWVDVVVTNDQGQPEVWSLEAGATNTLMRLGWKRDSLKPGDTVDAAFYPMKNGSHAGGMMTITTANGTVLSAVGQGAPPEPGKER